MVLALIWMYFVVNVMLGGEILSCIPLIFSFWNMMPVIMITRLHAMYQQSRKMLIFLVVIFLAITISCGVMSAVGSKYMSVGELNYGWVHWVFQAHVTNKMCSSSPTRITTVFTRHTVKLWSRLGYSTPYGRSLRCVLQSGSLQHTSVDCNNSPEDGPLGTASGC